MSLVHTNNQVSAECQITSVDSSKDFSYFLHANWMVMIIWLNSASWHYFIFTPLPERTPAYTVALTSNFEPNPWWAGTTCCWQMWLLMNNGSWDYVRLCMKILTTRRITHAFSPPKKSLGLPGSGTYHSLFYNLDLSGFVFLHRSALKKRTRLKDEHESQ